MMPSTGIFTALIPSQPYNTAVYYKVTAQHARGELIVSGTQSYKVADFQPPTISYVGGTPVSPKYNETVIISANVSEPPNASGVKLVILSYWNGSAWTNITMALGDKLYTAMIPPLPYGTSVTCTIWAFDYAQNVATLDIYSYTVTDRYLPTARIDDPTHESYLKSVVPIRVTGNDTNFNKMELYISGELVQTWDQQGSEIYYWDTTKYTDGVYIVKLTVYDKAGNISERVISVTIDNTVPGWTLALIASFALTSAALIGTGTYITKIRKKKEKVVTPKELRAREMAFVGKWFKEYWLVLVIILIAAASVVAYYYWFFGTLPP